MRTVVLALWVALIAFGDSAADTWAVKGTLLTPGTTIENGFLVITDGTISDITQHAPARVPSFDVDGIVLPGFIDLHNHLTWNVFPRWRPAQKFSNRYEWQDTADFDRALGTPHKRLIDKGLGCEANFADEIRALVGGATSVVGSYNQPCVGGLVRNLDFDSKLLSKPLPASDCDSLNPPNSPKVQDVVVNEVFPLAVEHTRVDYLRCKLTKGELRGLVIHLAEGKPLDAGSRREFAALKALELVGPGLVIVHGTALTLSEFQDISIAGLVWSPRSNDELYGGTANVPAALKAGVSIAIAPDWSPSGSSGILQEINYANSRYPKYFTTRELVSMATSVPAKLVRLDDRIGALKKGLVADFIVMRNIAANPFDSIAASSPADVRLVVVGGKPIYGDADLMRKLLADLEPQFERLAICGSQKALYLGGADIKISWTMVRKRLEDELQRHGINLNPFECD